MRKLAVLLLSVLLMLSLCSCKSKEAQAVDDLILAIGEVSLESRETIEQAQNALDELDSKKKEQVENTVLLEEAQAKLEELEAEDYQEQYYALVNRMIDLHNDCGFVCSATGLLWNYWDAKLVPDLVGMIRSEFYSEEACESLLEEKGWKDRLLMTVPAFYSGYETGDYYGDYKNEEVVDEVISGCVKFTEAYDRIIDEQYNLGEDIRKFKDKYEDTYTDEVGTLNEWFIDISLFADMALEPSGSLASYIDALTKHRSSTEYYMTVVDTYY